MRSYLVVLVLTILFGAFFVGIVQEHRGYILIVFDQISVGMNIWMAILAFCTMFFILITVILIFFDLSSGFGFRQRWEDHLQNKSLKSTMIGLQSYVLGSWSDAVQQLSSQKISTLPPDILMLYVA